MFVMAELGSSCVKVVTVCRDCGRNIKRSSCSEDNLCDDCEDMVIGIIRRNTSLLIRLIFYLD